MKKMKYILLFFAVATVSVSCKKFLEENPTNFINPNAELSTAKVARSITNGAYQHLRNAVVGGQPSSYGGNTWNLMEFMTGKTRSDLGQTGYVLFQTLNYNETSFYMDMWWQYLYKGIGACNQVIQMLPNIQAADLTDDAKTNMLAEAYTLRALQYFYLVRMYGAVPKVTELPTSAEGLNLPRVSAKEIYDDIIIPDLLRAEASTLPWRDGIGLVSMGLVKALLADVYLTYAGAAINGGNENYAESAKRSLEVIQSGAYELFPEYTDMINPANKNTREFIFQIQFSASANTSNPLTPLNIPNYSRISKYSDEYGSVYPTAQFINSYAAGDKRAKEKQFFYTNYPHLTSGETVNFGGHYIYKWFDRDAVLNTDRATRSDLNYTLYRYADVMLLYAEAANRAEGTPNTTAIKMVNDIRDRAELTPIAAMGQDAFEKEVWSQRYYELCFENKMWFDMVRTRKIKNDVTGNWDDFVGHTTVFGQTYADKQLLFPVPKQETDVNPNLLPNNPGFSN